METPGVRPPIERYVRASVDVKGGSVELGVQYFDGEDINAMRELALALVSAAVYQSALGDTLTPDIADYLTTTLDDHIVSNWGDRGRFIEVWNATSALTQVYVPCGMPMNR